MIRNRLSPALLLLLLLVVCFSIWARGGQDKQSTAPSASGNEKAEAILKQAVAAIGGSNYLNVRSLVGRGLYTSYQEGMSQIPSRFLDYIVYPDKERTEFTGAGIRTIQTNIGDKGWVYDGATKTLTDMKPAQVQDFKRSMRASMENVLRGWWRKEGATLSYAGRREAGLARRNETVRLTYPDGFWIEYEFGAKDGLPSKIIYKQTRNKADSDETEEITEEDRLAKPITIDSITAPFVIDHFINGIQASRINYEAIQYNQPIPDSIFSKPENIKTLK